LFSELPVFASPTPCAGWLITVAAHQSSLDRKLRRRAEDELTDLEAEKLGIDPPAVSSPRSSGSSSCARRCGPSGALPGNDPAALLSPAPVSYREVAARLGLATGSIGFIRGRCLKRLERSLAKWGM